MTDFAALRPGTVFASRYRIERLLKSGGMGAVYVVRHVRTGALHALKVMRPEIVRDPGMRERFAQEAQVSSVIESAHVVSVTDADVDPETGIPFLVMEFLRGQELGELLAQRGRFAARDVVDWLSQVARALDKAHVQRIVHRDLKPENLFLVISDEAPPRIKILDFGIAKIVQSATHAASTQGGGTPLYMAPEQTRKSRDVGPATDVWALGLIAYALLVGRPYWEAETIGELYGEILASSHEPASARAARYGVLLPTTFDAWFARCVNADPRQRFQRAGEAVAALAVALDARAPAGSLTPNVPQVTQPMPARTVMMDPAVTPLPNEAIGGSTTLPSVREPSAPRFPTSRAPRFARPAWLVPAVAIGALAVVGVAVLTMSKRPDVAPSASASASSAPRDVPSASAAPSGDKPSLSQITAKLNPFIAVHSVSLQRHEVTRDEYAMWIDSLPPGAKPAARPLSAWTGEPVDRATGKQPVIWVTHARAARYCAAIDARLPTSSEWSSAMNGAKYPWGNAWPPPANVSIALGSASLPPVETAAGDVTSAGVRDLFGSVREWTADVADGFAIIRGASASTPMSEAAAAFANASQKDAEEGVDPSSRADEIAGPQLGFRCAR